MKLQSLKGILANEENCFFLLKTINFEDAYFVKKI